MINITAQERDLLLEKVIPLGKITRHSPQSGQVQYIESSLRHFVIDGGLMPRRPKSVMLSDKELYDPAFITHGICEALTLIIQENYDLYVKMFNLVQQVEQLASRYIHSCEETKFLFGHSSFGPRLYPHIHIPSSVTTDCLSIFVNLTGTGSTKLRAYQQIDKNHEVYAKRNDFSVLREYIKTVPYTDIVVDGNYTTAVLFDSTMTPHEFHYSDDLWAAFVFDQALIKDSLKDKTMPYIFTVDL